ncbi:MAG TPA: carboxypeptidase-like regulatory domain-containing protein, partial [Gemmatimonadaceae bacterium]|nr:carboxypeptidase-like regulatory domain-containing protein [Gemmatimonadaceae bacterium]
MLLAGTASAQSGVIAGTVVSAASGAGVPAVTVMIPGTTLGTTTDANGRFRLGGLSGTSTALEVRRIGYRPLRQTVTVGTMNLRFAITEQSVALDEVVVTGTVGGQARREIGNAVSTVNATEVTERGTINNVQQLLNGRSPG